MFRFILTFILFFNISLSIYIYSESSSNDSFDYNSLYKEIFGEELQEEIVTTDAFLLINDRFDSKVKLRFKSISLDFFIDPSFLYSSFKKNIKENEFLLLESLFNKKEISNHTLADYDINAIFNPEKQILSLDIPYEKMNKIQIPLTPYENVYKINMDQFTKKPLFLSGYVNYNVSGYKNHLTKRDSLSLSYSGRVSLPLTSLKYAAFLSEELNSFSQFYFENYFPKHELSSSIGSHQSMVFSASYYSSYPGRLLGLSLIDERGRGDDFIPKKKIKLELPFKSEVQIFNNNRQIYKERLPKGTYEFVRLPLQSGKNNIEIIAKGERLIIKKFTFYYTFGLNSFKFRYSFISGFSQLNSIQSLLSEDFNSLFNEKWVNELNIKLGLFSNLQSHILLSVSPKYRYISYSFLSNSLFGLSRFTISQDYTNFNNLSKPVLSLSQNWNISSFILKKLFISSLSTSIFRKPQIDSEPNTFSINNRIASSYKNFKLSFNSDSKSYGEDSSTQLSLMISYVFRRIKYALSWNLSDNGTSLQDRSNFSTVYSFNDRNFLSTSIQFSPINFFDSYQVNFVFSRKFFLLDSSNTFSQSLALNPNSYAQAQILTNKYDTFLGYGNGDLSINSNISNGSFASIMKYRLNDNMSSYRLKSNKHNKTQSFNYSNSLFGLTITDTPSIFQMGYSSAIAFSHKNIAISSKIRDGFVFFSKNKNIPKNSKIYARVNSFWGLSALDYGKSAYGIAQVSYDYLEINNHKIINNEKLKYLSLPFRSYNFDVNLQDIYLSLTLKIFDKQTGEPIYPDTYTLQHKEFSDIQYFNFSDNNLIKESSIISGEYFLLIDGYAPYYIDARNISFSHLMLDNVQLVKKKIKIKLYD